jgi:NADPH-dependent 2,4-dienoyl-CoA reductase/sulfur reductase-like enzyme/rhodanese-related sulfurtransferase
MSRKILIVGGVAGGASAAAKLRRNSEADKIIMFEKGPHVSFSNCALPYHLSGKIEEADDLILMDPELFASRYNIEARVYHEVISIDRAKKHVTVRNIPTHETYDETYDKLVLSPGAKPKREDIPGLPPEQLFNVKNVVDVDRLKRYVGQLEKKDVAVIGGGFIGIETAENLKLAGYNVTIIVASNQILNTFDYDMVQIFHKVIHDNGIKLLIGEKIERFENDRLHLVSGKIVDAKAVVVAKGVTPEIRLAKEAGLELGKTGAIKVDKYYKTNDPDIYAVGDAIEVYNALTHAEMQLTLAGPALKAARAVAEDINGKKTVNKGYIGSSAIKVFDYNGAATGLSEAQIKAQKLEISYDKAMVILPDKVGIMPDSAPMFLKLLFEIPTGRVLGAQAIGQGDVTKRVDIIATLIKFNGTVEDLKDLELCYAPPFSTAKDVVNYAGYISTNLLNQEFKQIHIDDVRGLVENKALIIDVREKNEYKRGHIKGALNIPLSELRNRICEIPHDQPVYLHCRTGQRSYNATLALQHSGYDNVYNITGSYLGLSYFEYFNDVTTNRESILTKYNFR